MTRVPIGRKPGGQARPEPPRWPLALELARAGRPIGVVLLPVEGDLWAAVTTDVDGVLVELRRLRKSYLIRWCLNRHLRIHHRLGTLVDAQLAGRELGWVPGLIIEYKRRSAFVVTASVFSCTLPGEAAELNVSALEPEFV